MDRIILLKARALARAEIKSEAALANARASVIGTRFIK